MKAQGAAAAALFPPLPMPAVATRTPVRAAPVDSVAAPTPAIPTRQSTRFDAVYEARMGSLTGHGASFTPQVRFLRDGDEALRARLNAINSATSSILMTTYALEADEVTTAVLQGLIARAKAGVRVVVKSDAFPSTYIQNENASDENRHMFRLLRELEAAGGVVLFYGGESDNRQNPGSGDHLKCLLTDGRSAIAGGRNMSSDYFHDWRDLDAEFGGTIATTMGDKAVAMARRSDPTTLMRWRGPRADIAQQRQTEALNQIAADIRSAERTTRPLGVKTWMVAWDPTYDHRPIAANESENRVTQALVETFDRASREIIVSSNYVNGCTAIREALLRAGRRGVKIKILTTSELASDRSKLPYLAAERHYAAFMALGAEIWEKNSTDHAKMYVVDNEVAAFGSYNLEHAADTHLVEQLVFSRDPAFVAFIQEELEKDMREICTRYVGPPSVGFFGSIWRWFQKILGILTEDYF